MSRASAELKAQYKNGDVASYRKQCYKVGNVFDISQTNYPKENYPQLFSMGYPSEVHEDICRGLADFSREELGCSVVVRNLRSITLRGQYVHSSPPRIELNDKLESTQKLSTLSHELGHAVVHRDAPASSEAQKEFEADVFSIMLSSSFGLELTDARKKHLADHYWVFSEEIVENVPLTEAGKVWDEKMMESFSNVFRLYKDHADEILRHVEKYVPREMLQQENLGIDEDIISEEQIEETVPVLN